MIILFIARNEARWPGLNDDELKSLIHDDSKEVRILRDSCLWFYETQKTTIGEMRKYFTEHAIVQLLQYNYFEFI